MSGGASTVYREGLLAHSPRVSKVQVGRHIACLYTFRRGLLVAPQQRFRYSGSAVVYLICFKAKTELTEATLGR